MQSRIPCQSKSFLILVLLHLHLLKKSKTEEDPLHRKKITFTQTKSRKPSIYTLVTMVPHSFPMSPLENVVSTVKDAHQLRYEGNYTSNIQALMGCLVDLSDSRDALQQKTWNLEQPKHQTGVYTYSIRCFPVLFQLQNKHEFEEM